MPREATRAELVRSYDVLQVPPVASARAIHRQYRRLARHWHPDRFPAGSVEQARAAARMREINAAYAAIRGAPLADSAVPRPGNAAWTPASSPPAAAPDPSPFAPYREEILRFAGGAALALLTAWLLAPDLGPRLWLYVPGACVGAGWLAVAVLGWMEG